MPFGSNCGILGITQQDKKEEPCSHGRKLKITMTDKQVLIAFLPGRNHFRELRRPWKLATFGIGMSWLLYGAVSYDISDWDVGISLVMGVLTYLCAPWSVTTIYDSIRHKPVAWPLRIAAAFVPAMFAVDWAYWLYHTAAGNRMLRGENFKVSMALYFICGLLWYYRGSLKDLLREARRHKEGKDL